MNCSKEDIRTTPNKFANFSTYLSLRDHSWKISFRSCAIVLDLPPVYLAVGTIVIDDYAVFSLVWMSKASGSRTTSISRQCQLVRTDRKAHETYLWCYIPTVLPSRAPSIIHSVPYILHIHRKDWPLLRQRWISGVQQLYGLWIYILSK